MYDKTLFLTLALHFVLALISKRSGPDYLVETTTNLNLRLNLFISSNRYHRHLLVLFQCFPLVTDVGLGGLRRRPVVVVGLV
jgi:hypothetical protein